MTGKSPAVFGSGNVTQALAPHHRRRAGPAPSRPPSPATRPEPRLRRAYAAPSKVSRQRAAPTRPRRVPAPRRRPAVRSPARRRRSAAPGGHGPEDDGGSRAARRGGSERVTSLGPAPPRRPRPPSGRTNDTSSTSSGERRSPGHRGWNRSPVRTSTSRSKKECAAIPVCAAMTACEPSPPTGSEEPRRCPAPLLSASRSVPWWTGRSMPTRGTTTRAIAEVSDNSVPVAGRICCGWRPHPRVVEDGARHLGVVGPRGHHCRIRLLWRGRSCRAHLPCHPQRTRLGGRVIGDRLHHGREEDRHRAEHQGADDDAQRPRRTGHLATTLSCDHHRHDEDAGTGPGEQPPHPWFKPPGGSLILGRPLLRRLHVRHPLSPHEQPMGVDGVGGAGEQGEVVPAWDRPEVTDLRGQDHLDLVDAVGQLLPAVSTMRRSPSLTSMRRSKSVAAAKPVWLVSTGWVPPPPTRRTFMQVPRPTADRILARAVEHRQVNRDAGHLDPGHRIEPVQLLRIPGELQ